VVYVVLIDIYDLAVVVVVVVDTIKRARFNF
jgi:hypothetical protein